MSVVGSVAIILATAILWKLTGSTDFTGTGLSALSGNALGPVLFWLLIFGFAVKAGMFPVHVWLPVAHPIAPSPASALLSGVMIKAGAYGIIRVVYGIFGAQLLSNHIMIKTLMLLAVITLLLGSILAILQKELKRMLAYSSVAQIGYVVLGITLLNANGLAGGVLHIFNHALMKGALFLAAGSVIHKTGLRQLSELKGLGKKMPWTMAAITMAALSMIGVPPFIGFFSKWLLGLGALDAGSAGLISSFSAYGIVAILVFSGLLNMVYYGPIIIRGWFMDPEPASGSEGLGNLNLASAQLHATDGGEPLGHAEETKYIRKVEPTWLMTVPTFTLALGTLVFGLAINLPMRLVESVVRLYFG